MWKIKDRNDWDSFVNDLTESDIELFETFAVSKDGENIDASFWASDSGSSDGTSFNTDLTNPNCCFNTAPDEMLEHILQRRSFPFYILTEEESTEYYE